MSRVFVAVVLSGLLTACLSKPTPPPLPPCASAPMIGQFNPQTDVFVGHFDSKPDVDDLHTVAAVGSLLQQPALECVEAVGVAGAYGVQGGEFIPSPSLFDLAYGENWLDGHSDRSGTIAAQANLFVETLQADGHVWIMVAGQADIAADALAMAMQAQPDLPYKTHIHLVQHSGWNESVTASEKLAFVQANADYQKIADGNAVGNGTPGYTTNSSIYWPSVLADPRIGPLWQAAKTLADERNPEAAYVNPSVAAGGFDFSDTAEMAHIFGLQRLNDVGDFFDFVLPHLKITWPNGSQAALALTYDDALNSQLEVAVPHLDAIELKATFYVSLGFDDRDAKIETWRSVAASGHELGNHTLVHPCRGSLPGRDWVQPNRDLDTYSKAQLLSEIEEANALLIEIDGKTVRTFAYTCGDVTASGESFINDLRPYVVGARSVVRDAPYDPYFVPSFAVDQTPAREMIAYVDELIAKQTVGTITFHGIGADHLSITETDHKTLLAYLKAREAEIWVAPLVDILTWEQAQSQLK
ncbi:MAG: polysaccharide deacetylase family protein [Pseudomonadota bacterium]